MGPSRELWLVAGEASGDTHAAHLVRKIQEQDPSWSFVGFGGPKLREAGMNVLQDLASEGIMGLFPVVAALPRIRQWFRQAEQDLRDRRPSALILVDYPGFNIRLAAKARALGIPVIYYISPQVWAWAGWRKKKLARLVDLMLVILPFEADIYRECGPRSVYVGHPLMDHLETVQRDGTTLDTLRRLRGPAGPLLGVFPGSRRHVVQSLLPVFLETVRRLRRLPGSEGTAVVVACAQESFRSDMESMLGGLDATILVGRAYEIMAVADLALTSSGTTTLEIAAHDVPFVLGYRVSPVLYGLGRALVSVPHIGLVNLVAGEGVVPEHIGVRSFAEAAARDLHALWTDEATRTRQLAGLQRVRQRLEGHGSYRRAADAILAFLTSLS